MSEVRDNTNYPENRVPLSPREITDVKQLHMMIEKETKKPAREQDARLINECIQTLAQAQGVRAAFSTEELDAQIAAIKTNTSAERSAAAGRPRRRKIALLAACLAVVMLASTVTAYAVSPTVRSWIRDVLKLPAGETIVDGNVTYTHTGEFKKFASMEELLISENINIFYPTALPKQIRVKSILSLEMNGVPCYSIGFTTQEIKLIVQMGNAQALSLASQRDPYINEIGTFYIREDNDCIFITGIICNDLYNFTIKTPLNVKDMLDSLKTAAQ